MEGPARHHQLQEPLPASKQTKTWPTTSTPFTAGKRNSFTLLTHPSRPLIPTSTTATTQQIRKAPGPDRVSPSHQLAPIFTWIFNRSLEQDEVPSIFKHQHQHQHHLPNKPSFRRLNNYRPVPLIFVVMKSFERLVLSHPGTATGSLLAPLQFAYQAKRSVDDAVNLGLHYILQHPDSLNGLPAF